jgi:hypothetical protein
MRNPRNVLLDGLAGLLILAAAILATMFIIRGLACLAVLFECGCAVTK